MSKIKIFNNQTKKDIAFLSDKRLKKIYEKKRFCGKLKLIGNNPIKIKNIQNRHLQLETNSNNIKFAYFISKLFSIKKEFFLSSLKSFKGLPHRHEIFLKIGNHTFINDSKATSFESTKFAFKSNNNIIWITGGQPKKNDKFEIDQFKKR